MWWTFYQNAALFLSGGFFGAILNWYRESNRERTTRHVEHLTKQLASLYGPLNYLAAQNDNLIQLNIENNKTFQTVYIEPNWSEEFNTQKTVDEESTAVIDLMNKYSDRLRENNNKMVRIIESNYSLADPEDFAEFQKFATDCLRGEIELVDGRAVVPRRFHAKLERIHFYRQEFTEQVRRRCELKLAQLKRLRTPPHHWLKSSPGKIATAVALLGVAVISICLFLAPERKVEIKVPAGSTIEVISAPPIAQGKVATPEKRTIIPALRSAK